LLEVDPRAARAQVWVDDGQRSWSALPDLVGSGPLSPELVVEPESDGVARLRFGDGVNGRSPVDRGAISASYRVGGGRAGNVGAGRLDTWLRRPDGSPVVPDDTTVTVWNPLPGSGGTDPEPMARVRALAPTAYRRQLRAVTTADYARTAEEVPGVQRAVARRRWTGSWVTEEVLVDPRTARADDPELPMSVTDLLEVRRTAGVDVEVRRPVYVPLLITVTGCVKVGYLRPDVERGIVLALSAGVRADGRLGFFHPDRFSFGQGLYLSDLVATVMAVPGVSWVEVGSFGRLADPVPVSDENRRLGRIVVGPTEVLRCDSDPSNPENGRVEIVLEGG
jgi:predicted phage baseplate assembly protein